MYINKVKNISLIKENFDYTDYESYLTGKITYGEFCAKNFCTRHVMDNFLKESQLLFRKDFIMGAIKNDFFDIIDSEIKAYLLGFYLADGNVYAGRLTISVATPDREIIELYRENISPNSIIHIKPSRLNKKTGHKCKEIVSISISSANLCERLEDIGMGKRKTYNAAPDFSIIPDSLLHHFIRGYFDGDGCVCKTIVKHKYRTKSGEERVCEGENFNFNICSFKKEHLESLSDKIHVLYGIAPNVIADSRGYYLLEINKKEDFFKMRDIIYGGATYFLSRKKEKYFSIVSLKAKGDRKVNKMIVDSGKVVKTFNNAVEAGKEEGITSAGIRVRIKNKVIKNGYKWEYA